MEEFKNKDLQRELKELTNKLEQIEVRLENSLAENLRLSQDLALQNQMNQEKENT